jgi:uncharacterized protein
MVASLMLVAAAVMLRRRRVAGQPAIAVAGPAAGSRRMSTQAAWRVLTVAAAATGVGLLTGFFGVGGGFVIVPALVLALGFEMPITVAFTVLLIAVAAYTLSRALPA